MRVLFLDIDGVLNTVGVPNEPDDPHLGELSLQRVRLLTEALKPEVKVVISSCWRVVTPLKELQRLLAEAGLKQDVIDVTPWSGFNGVRGLEIQAWLQRHPEVSSFLCLDDEADFPGIGDHLIKTDGRKGLTMNEARWVALL